MGGIDFDGRFLFGLYAWILRYDHTLREWSVVGRPPRSWPALAPEPDSTEPLPRLWFQSQTSKEEYVGRVAKALDYIAAGDIYQVNLAHRLRAAWEGDPARLYGLLRQLSPAPYAAFLRQPGRTLLSVSPECFLRVRGEQVVTRPIKGTRPRGEDPESDARMVTELRESAKERAELIMITDLERNDLGKVCRYGSVEVDGLLELESYPQVHHQVSTVEGRLRPQEDILSTLQACFPGGSISGAPKKRALEIIAELEDSPRGIYTGAIGRIGFDGSADFSVAIRTMVHDRRFLDLWVGAGIVADSNPEAEYLETLHKARGFLAVADHIHRVPGPSMGPLLPSPEAGSCR